MPIDPSRPTPLTPESRTAERLADLARRVDRLERAATVTTGTGPPTADVASAVYIDSTTNRLYVRTGAAWRYTALT